MTPKNLFANQRLDQLLAAGGQPKEAHGPRVRHVAVRSGCCVPPATVSVVRLQKTGRREGGPRTVQQSHRAPIGRHSHPRYAHAELLFELSQYGEATED